MLVQFDDDTGRLTPVKEPLVEWRYANFHVDEALVERYNRLLEEFEAVREDVQRIQEEHEVRRLQLGEEWANEKLAALERDDEVKEIYGKELSELTPPIGYRFTGEFRIPKFQEPCMHPRCHQEVMLYGDLSGDKHAKPRLILEKLPPTPTIKDVYGTDTPATPKGWRFKEFRQVTERNVPYLTWSGLNVNNMEAPPNPSHWDGWRIVLEKEDEVVDLSKLTYPVTPEYIYGPTLPKVPAEYKVVGFRPPLRDELYLSAYGGDPEVAISSFDRPRLILSPLGPR